MTPTTASEPAKRRNPDQSDQPVATTRSAWDVAVDKVLQTSLLLVVAKLASSWVIAAVWGVPIRSRLIWGFVPYAGLQTSPTRFRDVAAWSTAAAAIVAVAWLILHSWRLRSGRYDIVRSWAAASALPMAALLAGFEWWRRFDAEHLISTGWLMRILLCLAAASVLFVGFTDLPWATPRAQPHSQPISPNPPNVATHQARRAEKEHTNADRDQHEEALRVPTGLEVQPS